MRLIFFGMPGRFSAPPLRALLESGAELAALVLPAPPGAPPLAELPPAAPPAGLLPLAGPSPAPSLPQIAAARGAPALAARPAGAAALAELVGRLGAELACVACWPWRIPPGLLAVPRHGFLNLHPSLLPELRGPEPLFWAFRSGAERAGVTVHAMDAGLDSGPIALQAAFDLPAGLGGEEAELRAAELGGRLMAEAVARLAAGDLALKPQGPGGSFLPAPAPADFALEVTWSARRAFGFMRGTAHWGLPYPISAGGRRLLLGAALSYDPAARLGEPLTRSAEVAQIQLSPGVLVARLASAHG